MSAMAMDMDGDSGIGGPPAAVISQQAIAAQVAATAAAAGNQSQPHEGPRYPKLAAAAATEGTVQMRRIRVPSNRYTPLRENWENIVTPIVKYMKLQIRMNTKTRKVEMKNSEHTTDPDALQKAADFVQAFLMGFELQDAVALLRLDDLFIDSFEITDVKMLKGDHLSRAIGRIAGQDGKTKFAIENATRTRIVVANTKIHILGSFQNIKVARNALCSLIMGSPPGKVYNRMRGVASRANSQGF